MAADVVSEQESLSATRDERRWHTIVALMYADTGLSASQIKRHLSEACVLAQADSEWSSSGIVELLMRARDTECSDTARRAALNLLDFVNIVERLRQEQASSPGASFQLG